MAMAEVFGISSCSSIISFKRNQDPIYQIIQPSRLEIQTEPHQNLQIQELYQQQHPQLLQNGGDMTQNATKPSRRSSKAAMKNTGGGEIVQVQGGHVVRATGRKDRHSKVYTAKGPRDRRVRLSAHTAIQFYDVQDRLGYDRPSKAVDWLIKKAKSSIDKLAELPPWHPTEANIENVAAGSSVLGITDQSESSGYSYQIHRQTQHQDSSLLDSIPENLKSFFPTTTSPSINFQSFQNEDLGLSLHSFQDQPLLHAQSQPDSNPEGYEANFHRLVAWNNHPTPFPPPPPPPQAALLGQDSNFTQRGPLQSSFMQSILAWNELGEHHRPQEIHQSFIFGSRFAGEGLTGYRIPARIHGEEEHSFVSDKPNSSSSPNSQH